eukprot:CAMPEP_0201101024 /NCGR_PEP_ID=MMETSP0812-20130820/9826_1 /ASSEMBLY_ACC=CAM_ASM_000668 /TAXON_ID=98059 /ORGANISM="Dinobryon sp., Strain UTEXLB2267" /LENGTH=103 /DNA_ID=CAMNT_0047357643 /DNA_START=282 /DNA_END=594 /DNA_ORIENTATION=+
MKKIATESSGCCGSNALDDALIELLLSVSEASPTSWWMNLGNVLAPLFINGVDVFIAIKLEKPLRLRFKELLLLTALLGVDVDGIKAAAAFPWGEEKETGATR